MDGTINSNGRVRWLLRLILTLRENSPYSDHKNSQYGHFSRILTQRYFKLVGLGLLEIKLDFGQASL